MADEIKIDGDDNIVLENVRGSTVNITKILGQSFQYQDLVQRLNEKQEFFGLLPVTNIERRLQISAEINLLTETIEQFKRDVLALAETFNKIEINTDRLKRAKEFFDKGEIGEARAVLETELEQMQDEQKRLLNEKERFETETLPKLVNNSEEFHLLAMATQTDYENIDRFEDTCKYFKASIESHANTENVSDFAYFLYEHNHFEEAERYCLQYLNDFSSQISIYERAKKLNTLANLHRYQNDYEKALGEYEEALGICRRLAEKNPESYLEDVAINLNNLAALHDKLDDHEAALKEYEEALQISRRLAKANPNEYLSGVAMTLTNLGALHQIQKNFDRALKGYEEAMQIYRQLSKAKVDVDLNIVAATLNNMGTLQKDLNNYEDALLSYENVLKIRRHLTEQNPDAHSPKLARALIVLSIYYQKVEPRRDLSMEYLTEAINILLRFIEKAPFTRDYLSSAITVLQGWDFDMKEIRIMLKEEQKAIEENNIVSDKIREFLRKSD